MTVDMVDFRAFAHPEGVKMASAWPAREAEDRRMKEGAVEEPPGNAAAETCPQKESGFIGNAAHPEQGECHLRPCARSCVN
jgi:hypothetical protein